MPLTERDVNTQRDIPRNKRHSIQREITYARLKDENSPSLRAGATKTTPPSQRLLAPTRASAAKVSSPARQPGQSTPQSHSKLPRRAPTPSTVPASSKWSTRVAERVASAEQLTMEGEELAMQRVDTATSSPHQTEPDASRTEKPLPVEKPLPSRPVASFINELSPSKDSRSLLDASEKPLTISLGDKQHAWPTLTPRSTSALASDMHMDAKTERPRQLTSSTMLLNSAANVTTAATGLSHLMLGEPSASATESESSSKSPRSSASTSLHTAKESMPEDAISRRPHDADTGHRDDGYPARHASLRQRISSGSIVSSHLGSKSKLTTFTDFTKDSGSATEDSRPHSPSPASFSRPRPGSSSHARCLPSPSPSNATPTSNVARDAAKAGRAQKTASRIPLPDVKKATLVDIRSRRSSGTSTPKSERGPTFGTRRLDAPDTLKILDQGIKRRQLTQLKRTNTNGSSTTATSSSTGVPHHGATPVLDDSRCSSPEGTCGRSSSDEEEVTTPADKHFNLADRGLPLDHSSKCYHDAAVKLFEGAVSALPRPPPSTSQFTGPLQTIPSQAILPFHTEDPAPPVAAHQRQPSDFAIMMKRFSNLHAAHADHTAGLIGDRAAAPESTRYSLMDILSEYEREDVRLSREGYAMLDDETRKNITRTLSVLEGNGSPPKTQVDNETLLQMFGHLKRGLEKTPKTASFVENAVAAQKYLTQPNSNASQQNHMTGGVPPTGGSDKDKSEQLCAQDAAKNHLPPLEAVASKWSDSTSSDKVVSRTGMSPQNRHGGAKSSQPQPPKRTPPKPPQSIGYPTRVPAKANALLGTGSSDAATPPAPVRPLSSPTLGKRKPGSVRAARETLDQVRGGFARSTTSAESKKTPKMPTPNTRAYSVADDGHRGRVPSAEKSRTKSDSATLPKTPRSRSKGRYVLDKINGLFSGKREKIYSPAPPIPSIYEDPNMGRDVAVAANGSPVLKAARGLSGAKMPTLSLSTHPALRNTSRNTSKTSVETPVDSVTAGDDNQALQLFSASLIDKAHRQPDIARRERMLSFAKVLNDSMICAREAQISAETAHHAAKSAQLSYEMTQKSVDMLQRLAGGFGFGTRT